MTEDEMVGWHCQLNGHEFEKAPPSEGGAQRISLGSGLQALEMASDELSQTGDT